MRKPTMTLTLGCGHNMEYSAYVKTVGTEVYCPKCETVHRVTQTTEVVAACHDCKLNRKFPNKDAAISAARKHSHKTEHLSFVITSDLQFHSVTKSHPTGTMDL